MIFVFTVAFFGGCFVGMIITCIAVAGMEQNRV